MELRRVKMEQLKPAPYNPRYMTDEELQRLKESIKTFGLVDPLIWNKRTGHVVGGNQRLKVLKELGYAEVDVVVVDIDEETEKALNIALNKHAGHFDLDKLSEVLTEINFDPAVLGFDEAEYKELITDIEELAEELLTDEPLEGSKKQKCITCPVCGAKITPKGELCDDNL